MSQFKISTFEELFFMTKNTISATPIIPNKHRQQSKAATPTEIPTIIATEAPPEDSFAVVTTGVLEEVLAVGVGVGVGVGGVYEYVVFLPK